MQIHHGVSVFSADEIEVGSVERVVIDPRTREVTHVVIGNSLLFNDSRIIPVQMIASADAERILLLADQGSVENLSYFEETHFISLVGEDKAELPKTYGQPLYWYPPAGMAMMGYPGYFAYPVPTQTEQNLPEELIALKDGAKVTDSSKEDFGEIEQVITDSESGKVTHFVVGWGLLQRRHKLIPALWVDTVDENHVRLVVPKRFVERLPEHTGE